MDNNIYSDNTNSNLPVYKVKLIAERLIKELNGSYKDDATQLELDELIKSFLVQNSFSGEQKDFHSLVLTLGSADYTEYACQVLEIALKFYPNSIDLLADYIFYGTDCNKNDTKNYYYNQVISYYKKLQTIPKRLWTTLAFTAVTYFFMDLKFPSVQDDATLDTYSSEIINILNIYKQLQPRSEEPYRLKALVYSRQNNLDLQIKTLKEALQNLNVCAKCALMYSELAFEDGNYEEALDGINKAIADSNQSYLQKNKTEGYLYFMAGLCKLAISQKNNTKLTKTAILDIYSDFNLSLQYLDETDSDYKNAIRNKLKYIKGRYNIEIPDELEKLNAFAQEILA